MDTIFTRQNEKQNIDLLCAQKQLYIEAKKILLLQILLTCPFIFVLAVLKLALASVYDFSAIALVCSSLIGLADILIMVFVINDYKKKAAKTQEAFDSAVYGLSWDKNFVGSRNPADVINKFADVLPPQAAKWRNSLTGIRSSLQSFPTWSQHCTARKRT